jgi:hypothetical protein
MRRFYFDVREGTGFVPDEVGEEQASLQVAEVALALAGKS